MDAGLKLYGKNPNIAPLSAQVKKAASYLVSIFINAIINKVIHDIKATPAAKPSNPSIKLIAFVMPTTHTIVSGIDKTPTLSQGLTSENGFVIFTILKLNIINMIAERI